ncbi:Uncharacterised protein [Legionella moravica]|uniref:Uncharacterized protein n=1 Tax=Legionella moravica TaxID=39962 RepID=A0A378JVQ4_9GAMM|nr:Uncharacterised protein [Legionella moravica]
MMLLKILNQVKKTDELLTRLEKAHFALPHKSMPELIFVFYFFPTRVK